MINILRLFLRKKDTKGSESLINQKWVSDNQSVGKIFQDMKSNFNRANLSRYDTGLWGYYFRYKMGSNSIELGFKSLSINGKTQDIAPVLHNKILDFFESQGKGTIREEYIF